METEVKNRAWVKDAAIIFLAILLVLTFFSQTIMNRSLVEVATQRVKEGPITAKVRGKGTVVATGSNNVKASGTLNIGKVMVKVGDKVNAGDVLFVLGAGDNDELEAAREELINLQNSYDQAIVGLPIGGNYAGQQNDIEKKKRDMKAAEEVKEYWKEEWEKEENSVPPLIGEDVSNDDLEYYQSLRNEWQKQINDKEVQINLLESAITTYTFEYDTAKANCDLAVNPKLEEHKDDEEYDAYSEPDIIPLKNLLDEAELRLNGAKSEQGKIDNLKYEVNSLKVKIDLIDEEIARIKTTSVIPGSAEQKYKEAERAYEDAKGDYMVAVANLQHTAALDSQSYSSAALSAQAIAGKIERQKEKIKDLAGEGEDKTITAKTPGIIAEIGCAAGDSVIKDDILAVIEVPDMGYTLSFSVTNDQARRLKVGDEGQISNFYWGSSITAKLKSIATDKKNPQTQKTLTFDLEGDVTAGSELTISVGQKSANYDLVVPNSAIKNDNNGSFVYAIFAKNSPLGNRYIAKRVSVEVLASDDTNSAVTADLSTGDFVITTTTAPIKNGDQVRLADNAS